MPRPKGPEKESAHLRLNVPTFARVRELGEAQLPKPVKPQAFLTALVEQLYGEEPSADVVEVPKDLEAYVQAGMERSGKTRSEYLLAAIKYVASREVLDIPKKSLE